jgi:predicted transposase/invertase (TIGR01784 family)
MKHGTVMHDVIFKIVFGTEKNKPVLRALLNALLSLSGQERIKRLTIVAGTNDKTYLEERGVILDVKAQSSRSFATRRPPCGLRSNDGCIF